MESFDTFSEVNPFSDRRYSHEGNLSMHNCKKFAKLWAKEGGTKNKDYDDHFVIYCTLCYFMGNTEF